MWSRAELQPNSAHSPVKSGSESCSFGLRPSASLNKTEQNNKVRLHCAFRFDPPRAKKHHRPVTGSKHDLPSGSPRAHGGPNAACGLGPARRYPPSARNLRLCTRTEPLTCRSGGAPPLRFHRSSDHKQVKTLDRMTGAVRPVLLHIHAAQDFQEGKLKTETGQMSAETPRDEPGTRCGQSCWFRILFMI